MKKSAVTLMGPENVYEKQEGISLEEVNITIDIYV